MPLGLGAHHVAAATITNAVTVVLSTSSIVLVFNDSEIIGEILPELFGIGRNSIFIPGPIIDGSKDKKITFVARKDVSKN